MHAIKSFIAFLVFSIADFYAYKYGLVSGNFFVTTVSILGIGFVISLFIGKE